MLRVSYNMINNRELVYLGVITHKFIYFDTWTHVSSLAVVSLNCDRPLCIKNRTPFYHYY